MYHSVSAKYLQTYLDEYCFLFNRRRSSNLLFRAILERVSEMASYGAMKNARERLPREGLHLVSRFLAGFQFALVCHWVQYTRKDK